MLTSAPLLSLAVKLNAHEKPRGALCQLVQAPGRAGLEGTCVSEQPRPAPGWWVEGARSPGDLTKPGPGCRPRGGVPAGRDIGAACAGRTGLRGALSTHPHAVGPERVPEGALGTPGPDLTSCSRAAFPWGFSCN